MEVHHHSHTERKKFKHYLFEFFMLFMAVFSGFLAEYYLEFRIERHREHEFIDSMVADLKEDTAHISSIYEFNKKQAFSLDTLVRLLFTVTDHPDSAKRAYALYYNYALNYNNVVFSDRTITQLKNSGGLRLIRNQAVSDSIMAYDAGVRNCQLQFEVVREGWTGQTNESYQLFDLSSIYTPDSLAGKTAFRFLTTDKKTYSVYANRLIIFSGLIKNYARVIRFQKAAAARLITYLKKEYHLE